MISDFELTRTLLDAVQDEGDFAILHREIDIANDRCTTDVDLACRIPLDAAIKRMKRISRDVGASLLITWPYDWVTTTLIFLTPKGVAQFDLLFDPEGRGSYGVRTGELLATSCMGERWRTLSDTDSKLYQLRKRIVKGQTDRSAAIIRELRGETTARAKVIFSEQAFETVSAAMETGQVPTSIDKRIPWRRVANHAHRLRHPIGLVVVTPTQFDAERFARELQGCAPRVRLLRPSVVSYLKVLVELRRPTVVVTSRRLPLLRARQFRVVTDVQTPLLSLHKMLRGSDLDN